MTGDALSTTSDARPGKFLDKLCVEQTSRWEWMVLSPLRFDDPQFGVIPVPVGFRTDFGSIRSMRVFLTPVYALLVGYGNAACTLHDMLYGQGILTRAECDAVLYRALRGEGVARWRAAIFWAGVRVFGQSHYTQK